MSSKGKYSKSGLRHFDETMLLIGAVRYYLGRMSAAGGAFAAQLAKAWPEISEGAPIDHYPGITREVSRR